MDVNTDDWIYYRSTNPFDISSWEIKAGDFANGGLPHRIITYANFNHHPDGTLFVTYRARYGSFGVDAALGGIARYDVDTQRWTTLGGLNGVTPLLDPNSNFEADDRLNAFFFSRGGATSGACELLRYNHFKNEILIDNAGRMHAGAVIIANEGLSPAPSAESSLNVVYAFSDDKGETWRRVDGSLINNLPLSPDVNINTSMTIANGGIVDSNDACSTAGLKPIFRQTIDGRISVSYNIGTGTQHKVYDGNQWVDIDFDNLGFEYNNVLFRLRGSLVECWSVDTMQWVTVGTDFSSIPMTRNFDEAALRDFGVILAQDSGSLRRLNL